MSEYIYISNIPYLLISFLLGLGKHLFRHKTFATASTCEDTTKVILTLSPHLWWTIGIGGAMVQKVFDPSLMSLTEILRKGRHWNKNNWKISFLLRVYYSGYTFALDSMGRIV